MPEAARLRFAFIAFTVAQVVSIFGDRLHQFSVVGMIGRVAPGSSAELLLFALFAHVPIFFFAPLFGAFVDRANRAVVVVAVDVFRGLLVATIPLVYHAMGNLYAFYITASFLAAANLLFAPAKSAAIPEYFGHLRLLRINALLWALGIVGTIGGFIVGGWLFDYVSWEVSFYADAASYLVSVVFLLPLLWLPRRLRDAAPATAGGKRERKDFLGIRDLSASFRDGFALIRADRRVAYGLIVQTSALGALGILWAVGIAWIQQVFPAGRTIYLSAIGTSTTVGLLVGSLAASATQGRVTFGRVTALCTTLLGLSLVGASQIRSLAPFMACAFVLGFAISPIMVVTETLLQVNVPNHFRGRVFAVREITTKVSFLGMSALATLSTTVAAKPVVLLATGVFLAVVGIWLERKNCLRV